MLLAATALAGCAAQEMDVAPVETPKTINVERVRVQFSPAFAAGSSELPLAETRRIESFLDQARLRPNDRVYVAPAAGDPLAAARMKKVGALLARRGIGLDQVAPPASGVQPNHLMLMVDRYTATPPACPDWSGSPATPHDNTPGANFGCATMTNLSLMVDNPRDLMIGRELAPADAEPAIDAVKRYRAGQVKPLIGSQQGSSQGGAGGGSGGSSSGMPGGGGGSSAGQ
jgi:pilus assembly protein CpaD